MLVRGKENRWKCWLEKKKIAGNVGQRKRKSLEMLVREKKRSGKYMNNTVKNTYLHAVEGSSGQQNSRTAMQNWFLNKSVTNGKIRLV